MGNVLTQLEASSAYQALGLIFGIALFVSFVMLILYVIFEYCEYEAKVKEDCEADSDLNDPDKDFYQER